MVTQPQKEDQILDYIEENAHRGKWSRLTLSALADKFKDRNFSEKEVKKIIRDLEANETLASKRLEYDFYCLNNMQNEIDKKLLHHTIPGKVGSYILSFAIYFILLQNVAISHWYTTFIRGDAEQLTAWTLLTSGFVISFLFIWALRKIIQKCWLLFKKEDTRIMRYQWMFYTYGILASIAIVIFFAFRKVYDVSPIILFYSTLGLGTTINGLLYAMRKDGRRR